MIKLNVGDLIEYQCIDDLWRKSIVKKEISEGYHMQSGCNEFAISHDALNAGRTKVKVLIPKAYSLNEDSGNMILRT